MSERKVDVNVTRVRSSMTTVARPVFSTPHVWRRIESALALRAVRVHFVARVDEPNARWPG